MQLEFVNHASFIVEHSHTRVICDPWLEGTVFNNGWNLTSPTQFQYEDFNTIDYIWFSHEHPDHFYPPNIKKIPEASKAKIAVLFQETRDKRVVNYCQQQKFRSVIELKPNQWVKLSDDFHVLCEHFAEGDSWICFKGNNLTYLNTNDCGIRNRKDAIKIKSKVGQVDILLTQFSYAYWVGNPEQVAYRRSMADEKLKWLKFQCDLFDPKVVIPIASCIYFCHKENNYLNDAVNTPRKAFDYINAHTRAKAVVLYPGDRYWAGKPHDSEASIVNYERDLRGVLREGKYLESPSVPLEGVLKCGDTFIRDINEHNAFYLQMLLRPAHIYLFDLGTSITLSRNGVIESDVRYEDCDAAMSTESLVMCFTMPYGLDTTQINGRLRKPPNGTYSRFYNFFRINLLKSRGENPNGVGYIARSGWRRALHKLGLHEY